MTTNLSDHLTLEEFTHSDTAVSHNISNNLPEDYLEKAKRLAENVFEPVRQLLDVPVKINSGYRGKQLNTLVRGVATSQHCLAEAIDLDPVGLDILEAFKMIIESDLSWDQLIFEGLVNGSYEKAWIHLSSKVLDPSDNREQILIADFSAGKAAYTRFDTKELALAWISEN